MINMSFNQGVFPNILKIANVIPMHKNGDKLDCNNQRPISLLSNTNKIYEKSMHICLINFLRKNKILFYYQFSFQNGYSVNHALTSLTELIRKALGEDKFACGIFVIYRKPWRLQATTFYSQSFTTMVQKELLISGLKAI